MQNVACPMMIVYSESPIPAKWNAEFSAIPVMMPGSASGSTSSSDTASRPKNRNRCTPKAAAEPSSSATAVANSPALSDSTNAARTCGSCQATVNHLVLSPWMGQLWMFDELNAYRQMMAIGTNRKSSTPATQIRSPIRASRPSITAPWESHGPLASHGLERAGGPRTGQVEDHDHDRDHGERGRERQVAGRADVGVDDVADEARVRPADQDRRDEVAQREREGEDRPGHHARQRQRQDHAAQRAPVTRAEIAGRLQQRVRYPLQRAVYGHDHEGQPDVGEDDPHRDVGVADVDRPQAQLGQRPAQRAALLQDDNPGVDPGQVARPQ